MKISIVCLAVLLAVIVAVQESSAHPHHKVTEAASARVGKKIYGKAIYKMYGGKMFIGKKLISKKVISKKLFAGKVSLKPKAIGVGFVGEAMLQEALDGKVLLVKSTQKPLITGGLAGKLTKKIIRTVRRPCKSKCSRRQIIARASALAKQATTSQSSTS